MFRQVRRVAHIGSKVRNEPPSFSKFRFVLVRLRARLVLSSHDVSAAQTKHLSRFESLRPRKSRQAVRSMKNNASRARSQSATAPSSITGFNHRVLTCKKRCGRGRLRFRQVAYLKNGNGAIDRSFAFPKRFLHNCQRQFKAKWLTYSASEDRGEKKKEMFLCTIHSVSQKSWSSRQCWAVDHETYDQLDKSFNNPEGKRCQQNAEREC